MTVPPAPSALHRAKRVGAFLAIVWGVAASFAMFDVLFRAGASRLIEAGGVFEALAPLSALESSEVCLAEPTGANGGVRRASPEIRSRAWILGVQMGLHARAALVVAENAQTASGERSSAALAAQRRAVDGAAAELERLAADLNVPRPAAFTPANPATVIIEFVPFVEGPDNNTGGALASGYGRDACELYKMGEYWGFSVLVRAALPGEPNIFAREIGYYARRVEVPESIWQPMVARTPSNASSDALATEADAATGRVTAYLRKTSDVGPSPAK